MNAFLSLPEVFVLASMAPAEDLMSVCKSSSIDYHYGPGKNFTNSERIDSIKKNFFG